MSVMGYS
jgi:hypothetical protein